jgi:hypothetical protein
VISKTANSGINFLRIVHSLQHDLEVGGPEILKYTAGSLNKAVRCDCRLRVWEG